MPLTLFITPTFQSAQGTYLVEPWQHTWDSPRDTIIPEDPDAALVSGAGIRILNITPLGR
jgi:hypothetical protein